MFTLESSLERRYSKLLQQAGWWGTKLINTSTPGIPDRLFIKSGRVVFIEFKLPGEKPRPLQDYVHQKIQEQGIEVVVASSKEDIEHLL
jgi:hypothetical protein